MHTGQLTGKVLLVPPVGFGYDPQTALSNSFQHQQHGPGVRREATLEFEGLVRALTDRGITVTLLEPNDPQAPNAVFPNNWFSTGAQGQLVLYPMATPSRRSERDPQLAEKLRRLGFAVDPVLDLGHWEEAGRFLEGTGSLVLDRQARKAFAACSERTDRSAVEEWCRHTGYTPIVFHATVDGRADGQAVYHTNVLMAIGERFAAIALAALPDAAERALVAAALRNDGKEVLELDLAQMHAFAGNMLQLQGAHGPCIFLSATAHAALRPPQRQALAAHGELVPVRVPVIEAVGGGSVRCMIAENFLPSHR